MDDVVILTMSEFGRTVRQNGNGGTDHGHAGAMFVIGGAVKGKQVLRPLAGPRARAAVRGARPRADDGLPLRCSPKSRRSTWARRGWTRSSPGSMRRNRAWLGRVATRGFGSSAGAAPKRKMPSSSAPSARTRVASTADLAMADHDLSSTGSHMRFVPVGRLRWLIGSSRSVCVARPPSARCRA